MSIRFLKQVFFVSLTDTKTNAVRLGVACVDRNTAAGVLRKKYDKLKLLLKNSPVEITASDCTRDQFYICTKGGAAYYGHVHELDLQRPLNFMEPKESCKMI